MKELNATTIKFEMEGAKGVKSEVLQTVGKSYQEKIKREMKNTKKY